MKKYLKLILYSVLILSLFSSSANALSSDQTGIFNEGVLYYDSSTCSDTNSTSPQSLSGPLPQGLAQSGTGSNTLNQEKTFLSTAATSTWNISNATVEKWFLKQAGAQSTIGRYGLSSSNIGQITSAVQAANVSPVFFYLDTVNEGGGAGGFINHYSGDVSGGGTANATRDAQYIASESKTTQDGPATLGGEPGDMPTAEAKSLLNSLPKGSIGVFYIQATSAVTAEVEDISGKTGDWSGKFGHPVSDMMQNIKTMGGNPLQGGSAISSGGGCTSSSTTSASCGGNGKYSAIVSSGSTFAGVDQGIDFVPSGSGGFNICAPAPGTITLADQTGHHFGRTTGQAEIIEKLDQTPNAPSSSQFIYYAEIIQINSNIKVGTHVNAGDTIGSSSQSPGIEVGWGLNSTIGFKCPIGYPTPCGTSFDSWVQGVSAGKGP